MDGELAPYPIEEYKKWCGLSNLISKKALLRLDPKCGFVDSVCDYTPAVDENNRSKLDKDGLPILSQVKIEWITSPRKPLAAFEP